MTVNKRRPVELTSCENHKPPHEKNNGPPFPRSGNLKNLLQTVTFFTQFRITRNQLKPNTMKRNILIIAVAIMGMALTSCINIDGERLGGKTIKGDGNIMTRTFDVSAFDDLSNALPATVNFTVSDDYTCVVRVDENIVEYLDIKVDEHDLVMKKHAEYNNTNLRATEFVIDVTAPSLEEINLAGSGKVNVLSPMEGAKMEASVAGSGDIVFIHTVSVNKIELSVAGSGDLVCNELVADELEADVAGSGDMKVMSGAVREAEASVAGSGDIDLLCDIENLDADIAGSGDIKARVSGKLEYSIFGSGNIGYYGNPVVEGGKGGSSKLKRLGD